MTRSRLRLLTQQLFILLIMALSSLSTFANANQTNPRILIVYFSQPENVSLNGVDAVSGASLLRKNNQLLSSTEYVSQLIQRNIGGDLFRIETVKSYPVDHDPLVQYAEKEQQDGVHPALKTQIDNLADYDTIFIGYPIWWYKMPMPLYSFFEQYDFSGKTIVPFTTHGGSGFSDSIREIRRLEPNANVITQGLAISRSDVANDSTISDVTNWLKKLNYLS